MLNKEHLNAMSKVSAGATVYSYRDAQLLREVQSYDSELINIIDSVSELEFITGEKFNGKAALPYFGAILTAKGLQQVKG